MSDAMMRYFVAAGAASRWRASCRQPQTLVAPSSMGGFQLLSRWASCATWARMEVSWALTLAIWALKVAMAALCWSATAVAVAEYETGLACAGVGGGVGRAG